MTAETPAPKLLDEVRRVLRVKHRSRRTEQTTIQWIKRYILFHGRRHPRDLGVKEIEAFLSHLAVQVNVAASTQNQAFNALLFLYREVLDVPLGERIEAIRARRSRRIPVVLSRDEVKALLASMNGTFQLMAMLLYGSGLRLMECVRLRVQDVDFDRSRITVRDGKGAKDRATMLPSAARDERERHLRGVRALHERDLDEGFGEVQLPHALARKVPSAGRHWAWQYVFPSRNRSTDPRSGVVRRHHIDETGLQKAVRTAIRSAGIAKAAAPSAGAIPSRPTCSSPAATSGPFRNSSATRTCGRRWSTPTCWTKARWAWPARWTFDGGFGP